MARERELKVVILGDATGAQRALGKLDASVRATDSTVERSQSKLSKYGPAIAGGATVATGLLLKVGRDAVSAADESRKVAAQTDAVIKSTGGAARVSSEHVADLAEELADISLLEGEAIQAGANMLLTFTNIRNQGAGKEIFDEATRAAADMAVAMKTEIPAAAMIVGKALNDPIAGLGALSRVGVQFTPEKERLIRDLVAVGDTVGAQKIIIGELNTQFGGSAKAAGDAATSVERLSKWLGELQETLGGWIIDRMGDFERGLRVIDEWEPTGTLKSFLDGYKTALDGIANAAGAAYDNVGKLVSIGGNLAKTVAKDPSLPGIAREAAKRVVDLIFHEGGPVPGAGGREVPAVLEEGEFVVRRSAVEKIGVAELERLNRFHKGGHVGPRKAAAERPDAVAWWVRGQTGNELLNLPPRGLRFRSDVRLDPSQVDDRRGDNVGVAQLRAELGFDRPARRPRLRLPRFHDGGPVGAIPAASAPVAVPARALARAAGDPFDYDRLAATIAAVLRDVPPTHQKRIENHFGPIHGLTLAEVEREADRRARLAALGGE